MTQPSYADQINAKYKNGADHFVDLKQRFNDTLSLYSPTTQATIRANLKRAIGEFQKRHGNVKSFSDPRFRLCQAQIARLANILIDTTMQRQLNISWVISIIENFRPWQAMPVQVYRATPSGTALWDGQLAHLGDDLYASWDGQHTAMAFYVIAVMIMGLDPRDVEIPVVIYEVNTKAEIRQNFIEGNTEVGKKLLDDIDIWQQMVYGVRVDGATDMLWLSVEKKQQYLESAGLFLTDKKFNDTDRIGAISRVQDVMNTKYSPELIRQFTVYAQHVLDVAPRAINTKELPIIVGFLKMANGEGVIYNDDELRSLAQLCIDLFSADFDAEGPFWARLEQAYTNWWESFYEHVDESVRPERPRLNKDWSQGGTFFWHQLKKSWRDEVGMAMPMPRLNIQTPFIPNRADLF
jgi:hypothetical protein